MIKQLIILCIFLSLSTAGCKDYTSKPDSTRKQAKNEPQRAVLDGDAALQVLKQYSRQTPSATGGTWKPTEAQINKLESLLPGYLAKNPSRRYSEIGSNLALYGRQYAGVITNKKRIIYVNFFIKEMPPDAKAIKTPVIVCDGGDGYWGIEFDVDTETFSNLETNGEA